MDTIKPLDCSLPMECATRSFISRAALLVKVTAAICFGEYPHFPIKWAILLMITRVLPEPAPASTRQGPVTYSTACCC